VVLKTVQAIEKNDYELKVQDESLASKAPKIFHETCEINFDRSTEEVHNFIRGLSPYPAAWTTLEGKELKILRTTKEIADNDQSPGTFVSDNKTTIKVASRDGFVHVHELQLQGRRRMSTEDFLNGYQF
jgi:methionyl-tRNA formyltransferase